MVALHVPIGILSGTSKQAAYAEKGYVQFATHVGLCRALDREAIIGGKAIVADPCFKEFAIELLMGVSGGFTGPRCVLNGSEEKRTSEWNSQEDYWHLGPFEWSYRLEGVPDDPDELKDDPGPCTLEMHSGAVVRSDGEEFESNGSGAPTEPPGLAVEEENEDERDRETHVGSVVLGGSGNGSRGKNRGAKRTD